MTPETFKGMVLHSEGEQFDVKAAFPDLSDNGAFANFLKNVLSISNTPRDSSSFILFGVTNSSREIVDVGLLPDEAQIQDRVSGNTNPCPRFIVHQLIVDGKRVAAIEFPPEQRLSQPTRSFPEHSLATGQTWFRNGSSNKCAVGEDLVRLMQWAKGGVIGVPGHVPLLAAWDELFTILHKFESRRAYLLLAHPIERTSKAAEVISNLGQIPWSTVIDLDRRSETAGLFARVSPVVEKNLRKIHRATLKTPINFDYRRGCLWYFSDGLEGQSASYGGSTFNEWKNRYRRDVTRISEELTRLMMPCPATLVVLWQNDQLLKHTRALIEELSLSMGQNLDIVVVSEGSEAAANLVSQDFPEAAHHVNISITSVCAGVESIFTGIRNRNTLAYTIPSEEGAPFLVPADKVLWLEEELEVLWIDIGTRPDEGTPNPMRRFLTGGEITWFSLAANHDVNREVTRQIQFAVKDDLATHRPNRINFYHASGGGGSTVARRVLFDTHRAFPSIRLRRLSNDTYQKIEYIARAARVSVLVMIDGGDLDERQLDDLFEICHERKLPVVILQVQRRSQSQQQRKRTFYLPSHLEQSELEWFADKFSQAVPHRGHALHQLCNPGASELHSPFFFGLTAYGKDFVGLPDFVRRRIIGLHEKQCDLMVFLALAHHYGQRSIPTHLFASHLGLPENSAVVLSDVFRLAPETLELLVETENNETRTVHSLIAEEILVHVLAGTGERLAWKQRISDWALRFAHFISRGSAAKSAEIDELAQRVFILRDNSSLLGQEAFSSSKFSPMLEDIPTLEGRRRVLEELSEIFPEEPHFLAHLARLYALQDKDFPRAQDYAARALALRPTSSTLYHVVGMVFREQAYDELDQDSPDLIRTCEKAVEAFVKCREFGNYEYGAISEAQLRLRVLDKLGSKIKGGVIALIGNSATPPFVRESYARVSELLAEIRSQESSDIPNSFESDCRARLNKLVESYESALNLWNALLDSKHGVHCPPVRRNLVWTYLQRVKGNWDELNLKHVDRIHGLMEANLVEEPRSDSNLKLWMRSVRHTSSPPSADAIIEKLSYWQTNTGSLEACYYLAIMHTLKAIDGSEYSKEQARNIIALCKDKAPEGPRGRRSNEWFGRGEGVKRIIHSSSLGRWVREKEFFDNPALLARLRGRITDASIAQAGQIELECGLNCFFVPSRGDFHAMDSELKLVEFFLGFSYQGLRAWEVKAVDE